MKLALLLEGVTPARRRLVVQRGNIRVICFITLIAGLALASLSEGQVKPQVLGAAGAYHPIDRIEYEGTLDLVFTPMPAIRPEIVFAMRIRYMPSFDPESQVLVVVTTKNTAIVDYEEAEQQINAKGDEMIREGVGRDPTTIAKAVTIRRNRHELNRAAALEWQRGMIQNLSAVLLSLPGEAEELYRQRTRTVLLDGTAYELRYAQGSNAFTWLSEGSPEGPALAKWAEELRAEVLKQ